MTEIQIAGLYLVVLVVASVAVRSLFTASVARSATSKGDDTSKPLDLAPALCAEDASAVHYELVSDEWRGNRDYWVLDEVRALHRRLRFAPFIAGIVQTAVSVALVVWITDNGSLRAIATWTCVLLIPLPPTFLLTMVPLRFTWKLGPLFAAHVILSTVSVAIAAVYMAVSAQSAAAVALSGSFVVAATLVPFFTIRFFLRRFGNPSNAVVAALWTMILVQSPGIVAGLELIPLDAVLAEFLHLPFCISWVAGALTYLVVCGDFARLPPQRPLLILRASNRVRGEIVFSEIAHHWSLLSPVALIAGTDLIGMSASFDALWAYVRRARPGAPRWLSSLDLRKLERETDGRFPSTLLVSDASSWFDGFLEILDSQPVVLMDLRGLQTSNSAALLELREVASRRAPFILIVNGETDLDAIDASLRRARCTNAPVFPCDSSEGLATSRLISALLAISSVR